MDGLGLARAIRLRHPELPVILVTGYSDTAALAAPEFAVLRKPYRLAEPSRAAAEVIAETRQPHLAISCVCGMPSAACSPRTTDPSPHPLLQAYDGPHSTVA